VLVVGEINLGSFISSRRKAKKIPLILKNQGDNQILKWKI